MFIKHLYGVRNEATLPYYQYLKSAHNKGFSEPRNRNTTFDVSLVCFFANLKFALTYFVNLGKLAGELASLARSLCNFTPLKSYIHCER